jgi:hypothetical protein
MDCTRVQWLEIPMKVNLLLKGLKILLFPSVIIVEVKKAVLFQCLGF